MCHFEPCGAVAGALTAGTRDPGVDGFGVIHKVCGFLPAFYLHLLGEDYHEEKEVDTLMRCNLSSCPTPWNVHVLFLCL